MRGGVWISSLNYQTLIIFYKSPHLDKQIHHQEES